MSSHRSRPRPSNAGPAITDGEIAELVSKLQALLPEARARRTNPASTARILQETCNCIRSLSREVEGLSERLSELLATTDGNSSQAAIIRSLLM